MLAPWHEFYVLLGTAAAALVALLFVAASIGAGLIDPARSTATRTYMSPIIFHYTCVLFVSLMVLVPDMTERRLAVIVALVALAGFGFSVAVLIGVAHSASSDIADRFGYGAGLSAGGCLCAHASAGANVWAGALVLLLLVNLRKAWELAIAFARPRTGGPPQG